MTCAPPPATSARTRIWAP